MFSTEDFIITVFCSVDNLWQEINQGQKIRKRGFAPSLSDSEVIAMEIVGEFQGIETDKGIWSYFKGHWSNLFPKIKVVQLLSGRQQIYGITSSKTAHSRQARKSDLRR